MKEFVGEFEKSQPSSGVAGIGLDSRLELSTKQCLSCEAENEPKTSSDAVQ